MSRWQLFGRGVVTPGLVALNVVALQHRVWPAVFASSFLISFVWAGSVRAVAVTGSRGDQVAYALGAGCGAVVGMVAGAWLA